MGTILAIAAVWCSLGLIGVLLIKHFGRSEWRDANVSSIGLAMMVTIFGPVTFIAGLFFLLWFVLLRAVNLLLPGAL